MSKSARTLLAGLCACTILSAQPSENLKSALREIFGSKEPPAPAYRWLKQGAAYTILEKGEVVRYDAATSAREVLTPKQSGAPAAIDDYWFSADGSKLLARANRHTIMIRKPAGEYWLLDLRSAKWRKLGGGSADLLFTKLSPDATQAAYVREADLYVEDLATDSIRRLTTDGSDVILNGVSDWVYDEEFRLADAFAWSPDGRSIAYWQFDQRSVPEYTLVNYTDSLYPSILRYRYPKAGRQNASVRVGVVDAKGGETRWIKTPGDPRDTYIPRMEWSGNRELTLEHMNRLQNTNDVLLANTDTGEARRLFRDQDEAWVDVNNHLRWLSGHLLWSSERDGWRHVYTVARDGSMRLVTTAPGDAISIAAVDETGGWLYYIASPDESTRRYLYRTRFDGTGEPHRITPANTPGTHTYQISTDARWAFHTWSRFDQPPTTELIRLPGHETVRVMHKQPGKSLTAKIEFVQVDGGDNVKLDGWVMKPRDFDASKKYPIVIYVYGEPAGTTAADSWYGQRTLFHAALADEGYIVASFDNSGTPSPKGRAWRKAIYGSVGVQASREQAAALRSLASTRPWIDLSRVAVWGWSGGGSMTDNLMFRSPDLYKVGVSVAAVPDQALYDTIYQERYMGLPAGNARGYHDGSPINFAEGLRGKLLIIHGSGDDNVHFQGNQRLINRLVELGKPFDFMEYPNRTHGLTEGDGTLLHVYTLIARYLEERLPPGPGTEPRP